MAAGAKNFQIFATSLETLLQADPSAAVVAHTILSGYAAAAQAAEAAVWRAKLGLPAEEAGASAWAELEPLLEESGVDFTSFWRKLADVREAIGGGGGSGGAGAAPGGDLLALLGPSFLDAPPSAGGALEERWHTWLDLYARAAGAGSGGSGGEGSARRSHREAARAMRLASPKYVPREWMLSAAYRRAMAGDEAEVAVLHGLFAMPYGEQPHMEARGYAGPSKPEERNLGGIAYMSCSS